MKLMLKNKYFMKYSEKKLTVYPCIKKQIRGYSYGGELARLCKLAHLGEISPYLQKPI